MLNARKIVIYLLIILPTLAWSQKKSEQLKAQQRELEQKIAYTKELLGNTAQDKQSTLVELNILSQQVSYRQMLLNNMTSQLKQLEQDIQDNTQNISTLEEDIDRLIQQYEKMLFYAYKNRNSYNKLMFVFSAETVHQAYRRMKYVQHYKDYVRRQIAMIRDSQEELKEKIELLKTQKEDKQVLIKGKDAEKKEFLSAKRKRQEVLNNLKSKESELQTELKQQQEQKAKLEQAIRNAIAEEIRKAREEAAKNNKDFKEASKEVILAGKTFESNKGKLPKPINQGEVTGKFGKQAHPIHVGVSTNNNGIDITTSLGANMHAVFNGEVTSVFVIAGAGKVVMVSHGNYRSVYANLQEAYVQKGDIVTTGQSIGSILANKGSQSEGHFEIWKIDGANMQPLNPLYWLRH